MTIIGRITKDAIVNTLKDDRKVVNFSIAINDTYKPKGGERTTVTTYCNCAYWTSEKMAEHPKKGALVEVIGRIYVSAFVGSDGTAKASLHCRVSTIKIHAWPREAEVLERPSEASVTAEETDDVPF